MATVESQDYCQGVLEEAKGSECDEISQIGELTEDVSYDDSVELSLSCTLASSDDVPSDNIDHLVGSGDDFPADGGGCAEERVECSHTESAANPDCSLPVSRSGRSLRRCRQDSETSISCPICRLALRSSDVHSHIQLELDKLTKINSKNKRVHPVDRTNSPRNKAYFRVKRNRLARQHAHGQRKEDSPDYTSCPVCNDVINGTPEELNDHVELCLNRIQRTAEDENVDVDDSGDEFEEYEWAGQKRVRASSMLLRDSPLAILPTSSSAHQCDDAIDLNIEDDDHLVYGQAQYSEADLLLCSADNPSEDKNRNLLRNALLEGKSEVVRATSVCTSQSKSVSDSGNVSHSSASPEQPSKPSTCSSSSIYRIPGSTSNLSLDGQIRTLKSTIDDLEKKLSETSRCLVCMESYNNPLTSVQCWHVYCEECWLRTLGAKKLCPQCNVITTPTDLRRIYL